MKGLDKEINFISKTSPIKFFISDIDGKKFNIFVNDSRNIELINFLIKEGLFKSNNSIFK
jgi:hypothetical protein